MVGIERDKWTSCCEACQHCERKQRACRQQDRDQVARLCVGRQSFSKSRGRVPQFTKSEGGTGIPDCDAASLLAGHALEVLDDRALQILVAKARKEPGRGAVPVQGTRVVLEPRNGRKPVQNAVRKVGARIHLARNAAPRVSGSRSVRRRQSTACSRGWRALSRVSSCTRSGERGTAPGPARQPPERDPR